MTITALPTPPAPSDSPSVFNTKAFALLGALPTFVTEANALELDNTNKVTGPASSTDNTLPRFDGTTGKLVQGSGVVVDDSNRVGIGRTPSGYALDVGNTATGNYVRFGDGTTEFGGYISTGNSFWGTLTNTPFYLGTNGVSRVTLDSSGNLTLSAGAFGYGAGAGGTVTQATSKSTTVTLNKPSGQITMNASALAAGATEVFALNNTFISASDFVSVTINRATNGTSYNTWVYHTGSGVVYIALKNISGVSLSDAVVINFAIIKGATT